MESRTGPAQQGVEHQLNIHVLTHEDLCAIRTSLVKLILMKNSRTNTLTAPWG